MQRNTDIEALRGYAIGITFIAHLDVLFPVWAQGLATFWLGGGVDLFFSISGFLITSTLLRALDEEPEFKAYAIRFWIRRIFRLWPAALLWSTAFAAFAYFWMWRSDPIQREMIAQSWIFSTLNAQNLYVWLCASTDPNCHQTALWHYWSLSLEEQFYLVVPILLFFFRKKKWLVLPILLIGLLQSVTVRPWGELLWFIRTDALCYGVFAALCWHCYRPQMTALFGQVPRPWLQLILATLLACLILGSRPSGSVYFMGIVALAAGGIVFCVSADSRLITRNEFIRWLATRLGERSYSLYLVHMPVMAILHEGLVKSGALSGLEVADSIAGIVLALAFSLLLTEASFRYVETPLRAYGRRITSSRLELVGFSQKGRVGPYHIGAFSRSRED